MMFRFFSGLGNILMSIVVGMSGTFVFVVLLVIVDQVVLPGGWLGLAHLGNILSQPVVDH